MGRQSKSGIQLAVEKAGGQRRLAKVTGIAKSYINRMYQSGVVPPTQCKKINRATGVALEDLNPKIYGDD